MDPSEWIRKRKGRYMAQILTEFEQRIESRLPAPTAEDVKEFKAFVRTRMKALADDAADLLELNGGAINGVAQEFKDKLSPTGRP